MSNFDDEALASIPVNRNCSTNQTSSNSETLYDDESGRYFSDVEEACDQYYDTAAKNVPEFLYGTKMVEASEKLCSRLADRLIEDIDEYPEFNVEDQYFSENLAPRHKAELEALLMSWLNRVSCTVEQDFNCKIPFRECYIKFCKEVNQ